MSDARKIRIDLYSDIVCPWCLIGNARLERAIAATGADVEVHHHPFLLRPDAPESGIRIADELRRKYNVEPKQLFERVESAARESDIALDLSLQPLTYPTVRAHTLVRHAEAKGTQRALATALFAAHFLEARNIADVPTLAEIASQHGFTVDEATALVLDPAELAVTHQAADEARHLGIRGVPFYVFDEQRVVSGCQSEAILRDELTHPLAAAQS